MTQKLLTYALGRGVEYHDEYVVDEIVQRLEQNDGRFSALLSGILESPSFQRQRRSRQKGRSSKHATITKPSASEASSGSR